VVRPTRRGILLSVAVVAGDVFDPSWANNGATVVTTVVP
jgi:hypothetical protein